MTAQPTSAPTTFDEVFAALATPLRADAAANRDRILTAARDLFNQGDPEASLERIAEHAGVGVGTAYRRFPTREHLLLHLFAQELNRVLQTASDALLEPDPKRGFVEFCYAAVPAMHATSGLVGELLRERNDSQVLQAAKARVLPALERLIARVRAELQPGFEAMDLLVVLLMCEKPFTHACRFETRRWEPFMEIMLRGLVRDPADWSTALARGAQ
ncbi:TetR/AcrR family transcriptional regulator [Micrococcales bacterium 31B]|nr:TetR/AcrR family transcriptional regulator [Micrococcales bacterium 31B]